MQRPQRGFTLVEIAIVLVVIGLLLGGVLKGQELIASSRVRNLADQQSGIQAAYFGFMDRYRAVPGDMDSDAAANAIGASINKGGNEDGRLTAASSPGTPGWDELNAVWEHLSKAGFIKGNFNGGDGNAPTAGNTDVSPVNVFSSPVVVSRDSSYEDPDTSDPAPKLLLYMGQNVPVDIARELDVKLDDGNPQTGTLRNAQDGGEDPEIYQSGTGCVGIPDGPDNAWNIEEGAQNCNPVYLF